MSGPHVAGPLPGPRSTALLARERRWLAPGVQRVTQLTGLAFDGGEGAILRDVDGNRFIDFFAGMGVASLGHGHAGLAAALARQASRLSATSFTTEARVELLENIARALAPWPLDAIQLYSGGAETVESALRLARAVTGRARVVGFSGGFHGKTAGVAGLSAFAPPSPDETLAPFPDGALTTATALDAVGAALARGDVAAVLVEPIQGTAGNVIPPADFLPRLAEATRAAGALFIADEMLTGWGRAGRLFASPLAPDVLLFGKGVAAGFPLSGLATRAALAAVEPWSRPSYASSSFGGGPLACAAGACVTGEILARDLAAHAAHVGARLRDHLRARLDGHALVSAVRGAGLMLGVDLVTPGGARPLDDARCLALFHACLRRGLIATAYTPRVRINPPLIIDVELALTGADLFADALDEVHDGAR